MIVDLHLSDDEIERIVTRIAELLTASLIDQLRSTEEVGHGGSPSA
jgi:hypothetical protein